MNELDEIIEKIGLEIEKNPIIASDLAVYRKYFGEPTIKELKEILDAPKLDDSEKIICIRGWLKLFTIRLVKELVKE